MISLHAAPIQIETARLLLRPAREADVTDEYVAGLNNPAVNEYLVGVKTATQTRGSVEAFVTQNRADPHGVLFGIFLRDSGRMIGTVRLHGIEPVHGTATIGICIFLLDQWGRGYSGEAIRAASDWAFAHLPVRYLEAGCYEANGGSVRAFEKAGFQIAARFEDKYLHNGRPAPVLFLKRQAPPQEAERRTSDA